MKEKMKYYDKEIERIKTSIIEAITILIVFLVSFFFGYYVGSEEKSKNESRHIQHNEEIQHNICRPAMGI